jgi:hypothetical protein
MTGVMVSSLTEQLRLSHQLSALQQSRMERVSGRVAYMLSDQCWHQNKHEVCCLPRTFGGGPGLGCSCSWCGLWCWPWPWRSCRPTWALLWRRSLRSQLGCCQPLRRCWRAPCCWPPSCGAPGAWSSLLHRRHGQAAGMLVTSLFIASSARLATVTVAGSLSSQTGRTRGGRGGA